MRILLADDDRSLRRVLQHKLEKHGYDVTAVASGSEALRELEAGTFDLLLSDIRMPGMDGLALLERARKRVPELKVILITAHATVSQAVEAVKLGAFDYVTKPFEDDVLFVTIDKALSYVRLERENLSLRGQLENVAVAPRLLGVSPAIHQLRQLIERIAATDATVLVTGASGTGKEVVARTIHARGARRTRELVTVNCAAIPAPLVESELFGHVRGAFTGAIRAKKGKFEQADGSTLFLDEVGELPTDLQAKLLRALQEKVIEPVGSEQQLEVDVRVIAATNADLQARVVAGRFREDLFYRLNVIPIAVPRLTERREDIPVLARDFAGRFAAGAEVTISAGLMQRLCAYDWPGNVRELENLIERMVVLRNSDRLTEADLPPEFGRPPAAFPPREERTTAERVTFHEAEQNLVREALEKCGWNRTRAAQYLEVPRHVLIYRMKKYGIRPPR